MMTTIMKRKTLYCGHVIRNYELFTTILKEKIEGKKAQGSQRRIRMNEIRDWLGEEINILRLCKDRVMWRPMLAMVANLRDGDAT